MNIIYSKYNSVISLVLSGALIAVLIFPFQKANAAQLTALSDTLTTSKMSTLANHDILFTTPTGVASGQTIILTFQSDFSIDAALDFTDIDVLDDGVDVVLAASPSGSTWGAVRTSSTVITLTNGTSAVGAGSVIRVKIGTNAVSVATGDKQITNPTSAANFTVSVSGTFTDTGTITVPILTDDQVSVSATVAQSITFSISDNSIGFGTLSSAAARYATADTNGDSSETEAHNVIVGTNATNGYTVTLGGNTLTSGANTITAIGSSNTASSVGSEQYGLRLTASGGSGAVTAPYAAAGFAFDLAAFPDQVASASGATANTTYSARYLANITANTEAGLYTSTLTYTATANY